MAVTTWTATSRQTIKADDRPFGSIWHHPNIDSHLRVSEVRIDPGRPGPVTAHQRTTEFVYVLRGPVFGYLDGTVTRFEEGASLLLAPGTTHGFKAVDGPAELLIVHAPFVPSHEDHAAVLPDFPVAGE